MPVQQVAFCIPPDTEVKIAIGVLKQWGGVVCDNQWHIVKHLKAVPVKLDDASNLAAKAMNVAKNNKNIVVGVGAAAIDVAVGAGALIVKKVSEAKTAKSASAEVAGELGSAMQSYLEAIQSGAMTEETIDALIAAIDKLGEANVEVSASLKQLRALCSTIYYYPVALERANSVKVVDFRRPKPESSMDALGDVRDCLAQQKQVFRAAE